MPDATINGFRHHWEEGGSGEPLVMIHGSDTSSKTLMPHMPELSKTFRVVIPDLRGFGASERMPGLHPSAWVQDIKALSEHLGLGKFHLYGVSLGSRIVLRTAIEHPELLRTLTVALPILSNTPEGNAVLNSRYVDPDQIPEETKQLHQNLHGDDWKTVLRNYFEIRNAPAFHEYLTLHELSKQVTVPTLIIRSDAREPVHPMEQAFELWNNIKGSRLWIRPDIAGSGSGLAAPEGYTVLRNFIASVVPAPVA
jgi:pimeloyl-ACP methyl ester carboxylesterase